MSVIIHKKEDMGTDMGLGHLFLKSTRGKDRDMGVMRVHLLDHRVNSSRRAIFGMVVLVGEGDFGHNHKFVIT